MEHHQDKFLCTFKCLWWINILVSLYLYGGRFSRQVSALERHWRCHSCLSDTTTCLCALATMRWVTWSRSHDCLASFQNFWNCFFRHRLQIKKLSFNMRHSTGPTGYLSGLHPVSLFQITALAPLAICLDCTLSACFKLQHWPHWLSVWTAPCQLLSNYSTGPTGYLSGLHPVSFFQITALAPLAICLDCTLSASFKLQHWPHWLSVWTAPCQLLSNYSTGPTGYLSGLHPVSFFQITALAPLAICLDCTLSASFKLQHWPHWLSVWTAPCQLLSNYSTGPTGYLSGLHPVSFFQITALAPLAICLDCTLSASFKLQHWPHWLSVWTAPCQLLSNYSTGPTGYLSGLHPVSFFQITALAPLAICLDCTLSASFKLQHWPHWLSVWTAPCQLVSNYSTGPTGYLSGLHPVSFFQITALVPLAICLDCTLSASFKLQHWPHWLSVWTAPCQLLSNYSTGPTGYLSGLHPVSFFQITALAPLAICLDCTLSASFKLQHWPHWLSVWTAPCQLVSNHSTGPTGYLSGLHPVSFFQITALAPLAICLDCTLSASFKSQHWPHWLSVWTAPCQLLSNHSTGPTGYLSGLHPVSFFQITALAPLAICLDCTLSASFKSQHWPHWLSVWTAPCQLLSNHSTGPTGYLSGLHPVSFFQITALAPLAICLDCTLSASFKSQHWPHWLSVWTAPCQLLSNHSTGPTGYLSGLHPVSFFQITALAPLAICLDCTLSASFKSQHWPHWLSVWTAPCQLLSNHSTGPTGYLSGLHPVSLFQITALAPLAICLDCTLSASFKLQHWPHWLSVWTAPCQLLSNYSTGPTGYLSGLHPVSFFQITALAPLAICLDCTLSASFKLQHWPHWLSVWTAPCQLVSNHSTGPTGYLSGLHPVSFFQITALAPLAICLDCTLSASFKLQHWSHWLSVWTAPCQLLSNYSTGPTGYLSGLHPVSFFQITALAPLAICLDCTLSASFKLQHWPHWLSVWTAPCQLVSNYSTGPTGYLSGLHPVSFFQIISFKLYPFLLKGVGGWGGGVAAKLLSIWLLVLQC